MATMAVISVGDVRFDDVRENLRFVQSGVSFANRAIFIWRIAWKAVILVTAFDKAIADQGKLIDCINGPETQALDLKELNELAFLIEDLVQVNDNLLAVAAPRPHHRFEPWMKRLSQIRVQRDTLESIAESLRSATDPEYQALLVMALEAVKP